MSDLEVARQAGTEVAVPAQILKYLPTFESGFDDPDRLVVERKKLESVATTVEDQRVVAAYKALEEGRQLVSLSEALVRGGLRSNRMPQLAVARSDLRSVRVRSAPRGTLWFSDPRVSTEGWGARKRRKKNAWMIEFPRIMDSWAHDTRDAPPARTGTARTPYIPPTVRSQTPEKFLVFWEAGPDWTTDPVPVPRPRIVIDPALLEHVVGDLYMVVATWDLTPIESAALDG